MKKGHPVSGVALILPCITEKYHTFYHTYTEQIRTNPNKSFKDNYYRSYKKTPKPGESPNFGVCKLVRRKGLEPPTY